MVSIFPSSWLREWRKESTPYSLRRTAVGRHFSSPTWEITTLDLRNLKLEPCKDPQGNQSFAAFEIKIWPSPGLGHLWLIGDEPSICICTYSSLCPLFHILGLILWIRVESSNFGAHMQVSYIVYQLVTFFGVFKCRLCVPTGSKSPSSTWVGTHEYLKSYTA